MRSRRLLLLIAPLLCLLTGAPIAHAEQSRFEFTELHMGVRTRIVLYAADQDEATNAAKAAYAEIARLDAMLSDYRVDSELSRLNAAAGTGPFEVSREFMDVLLTCDDMVMRTGGAFDPSTGPMVALWREMRKTGKLAEPEAVAHARKLSGWDNVLLDPKARKVVLAWPGMKLDMGGIAKGHAAMRARDVLIEGGHPRCMVALSGDVALGDAPPGAEGWEVAIQLNGLPDQTVTLADCCMSSSGDTSQYVTINEQRFAHIVDPRTGFGLIDHSAACVVMRDGAMADSLATGLSVIGGEHARQFFDQGPGFRQFIYAAAQVFTTPSSGGHASGYTTGQFPKPGVWPHSLVPHRPPDWPAPLTRIGVDWEGLPADPPQLAAMNPHERIAAQAIADEHMRVHWLINDDRVPVLYFDGHGDSIRTTRHYRDFEMRLDWKIGAGGDSGIYLRGVPQVQIWDNPIGSGGLYNNQEHRSTPLVVADNPVGEWNHFHIRMVGRRVTVWLNSQLVVDEEVLENYWDREAPVPRSGPIELQAHGTPLWFRNIQVRAIRPPDLGIR